MRVTSVLDSWMEDAHRHRRFMTVEDALARLHPDLHVFVHEADDLVRSQGRRTSGSAFRSVAWGFAGDA
jgi:hypothetical protein